MHYRKGRSEQLSGMLQAARDNKARHRAGVLRAFQQPRRALTHRTAHKVPRELARKAGRGRARGVQHERVHLERRRGRRHACRQLEEHVCCGERKQTCPTVSLRSGSR